MLKTVQMWSEEDGAVVDWDVTLRNDADGTSVIEVSHGDEYHRFSPNTTDAELENLAANIQHGVPGAVQELING